MAPSSPEPGPSAGPSSSKTTLGPALPPGFAERNQTIVDDDEDDYQIGPAPPPAGEPVQELGDGARAFLEREERLRRAEADAQAAKETAASSRPDWMLVPPTASSLSTILSDPKRALKSRGFQQNTRVQARGSLPTGPDPEGMSAWTETPEQRAQRLKDEVEGRRPRLDQEVVAQDEILRAEAQRQKDAEISARIKDIDPTRTTSLLDLHRQKRAKEHEDESRSSSKRSDKSREKDRDSSDRKYHDSRSRRHRDSDDEDRSSSGRHRSSRHRDDKGRSDDEEDEEERRERRRRKERRRERERDHRDSGTKDRHSSSSRRHSHSRRSRSPTPSASETDSEYERERRERKRRKKEKKRKLEEEAEAQKQAGPTGMSKTMIWDREKVMGVGSKVMDERGKAQAIRDAIGLRDRFAGGSGSRFM
ncbi:hypothetical protein OC861_005047 [Tilletia horrida]|nr:hypothetical protein OC861_005047 [Tilletia horrida]